ncbi:MAG TPA: uracil-DNA glycosylase [Steroidobacteraceae bacterium]|jgi:uracil-DNA glycosylase family 4|nr:uracil-DNA glycosylase [Steroidobacteraceae bacterium]
MGEAAPTFCPDCTLCPRLASFLVKTARAYPDYHCKPVAPFGEARPQLLIVGLAPGMHGANRTGRPFTGDYAGILLYESLHELGLASAPTSVDRSDGLQLRGTRITNAVKCLPPDNKPLPVEIKTCNRYLVAELEELDSVRAVLALGLVAHEAVLRALGLKRAAVKFAHGAEHELPGGRRLIDSYHCSRYNTQTRRLTADMFRTVLKRAAALAGL